MSRRSSFFSSEITIGIILVFLLFLILPIVMLSSRPTPVITGTEISPQPNQNDWYNQDVALTVFTREDLVNFTDLNFAIPWYENDITTQTTGEGQGLPLSCTVYNMLGTSYQDYEFGPVNVDKTPPLTRCNVTADRDENGIAISATIDLSAEDTLSGIDTITYQIGSDSPVTQYGNPTNFVIVNNTVITYYATDRAGNFEMPQSLVIDDLAG